MVSKEDLDWVIKHVKEKILKSIFTYSILFFIASTLLGCVSNNTRQGTYLWAQETGGTNWYLIDSVGTEIAGPYSLVRAENFALYVVDGTFFDEGNRYSSLIRLYKDMDVNTFGGICDQGYIPDCSPIDEEDAYRDNWCYSVMNVEKNIWGKRIVKKGLIGRKGQIIIPISQYLKTPCTEYWYANRIIDLKTGNMYDTLGTKLDEKYDPYIILRSAFDATNTILNGDKKREDAYIYPVDTAFSPLRPNELFFLKKALDAGRLEEKLFEKFILKKIDTNDKCDPILKEDDILNKQKKDCNQLSVLKCKNSLYGIIDKNKNIICPCKYQMLHKF